MRFGAFWRGIRASQISTFVNSLIFLSAPRGSIYDSRLKYATVRNADCRDTAASLTSCFLLSNACLSVEMSRVYQDLLSYCDKKKTKATVTNTSLSRQITVEVLLPRFLSKSAVEHHKTQHKNCILITVSLFKNVKEKCSRRYRRLILIVCTRDAVKTPGLTFRQHTN